MKSQTSTTLIAFICIIVSIWHCNSAEAQESNIPVYIEHPQNIKISLGYGNVMFSSTFDHCDYLEMPENDFYNYKITRGDKIHTPVFYFSYSYRIKRWFALEINAGYAETYQKFYDTWTEQQIGKYRNRMFYILPKAKFFFVSTKIVSLYSGAGIGYACYDRKVSGQTTRVTSGNITEPALELTYFGMEIGYRFYGTFEVGLSNTGFIKMGIGYRL